ncbi:hypothetical protein ASPBRDRAFT_173195 [Aspergillus brasiliensis CBS 101740]|uniref:Uncharacterized protein n=1 Tax=Aspergillus brasiliensis (strain CBS 101740 / IMI 381727 / IBT 21946) TaxID=767769 RepID=A0A1L9UUJ2_ASPBC|nr:hypothetical protein ASPBRDRAFT_173195 [Aspergillus brasiliensis CBS 101740]
MSSDKPGSYLPTPNNVQPTKSPKSKRKRLAIILAGSFLLVAIIVVVVCLAVLLPRKLKHDSNHDGGSHNTGSDQGDNHNIPQDGECHVVSKVSYTFYGYPDNDPPGADISEDCGRGMAAGGIGTHKNPLTFATAPGEFDRCEIVYSPYLRKYLINEDYCEQCNKDWKSHIWHVDVWLGGNSTTYGTEQLKCENSLTSAEESQVVIKNPSSTLPVDLTSFYLGGNSVCSLDHIYSDYDTKDYC